MILENIIGLSFWIIWFFCIIAYILFEYKNQWMWNKCIQLYKKILDDIDNFDNFDNFDGLNGCDNI